MKSLVLILALLPAGLVLGGRAETVPPRQLVVDGTAYEVRGVCYQPTPIGSDPSQSAPFGDYFTVDYAPLYERDLPRLREMGANTIRVYGWSTTAGHDDFLDQCWNGGVDPIRVLVNRWINPATDWSSPTAVSAIAAEFTAIDSRLGDHPAVLGLILGNEANVQNGNGDKASFWEAMNTIAGAVKAATPSRLVSMAITDAVPQVAARDALMTNLDFWSIQVYRGLSFGLFFAQYEAASEKPLIVTEWGMDAYDAKAGAPYPDNGALVGQVVGGLWLELAANHAIAAGGCVFEYSDEWWKGGGPSSHGTGGFPMGGLPDGVANEEWWGLFAISTTPGGGPDTLTPRAAYGVLQDLWTPAAVDPPEITFEPAGATVVAGGGVTLSVAVSGEGPFSYQWWRGGVEIPGATASALFIPSVQTYMAGDYSVTVSNVGGSVGSQPAALTVVPPLPSDARLTNLSTRALALTGSGVLIPGFVVSGTGSKSLLIRAVGASLREPPFNLSQALANPRMSLRGSLNGVNGEIEANDDWETNANAGEIAAVAGSLGAFPLTDGLDAALFIDLDPGRYTVVADGVDGTTGIAIVELYDADLDGPAAILSNISNRGFVGQGGAIMIPGVVISSEGPKTLLVRAVGPALEELFEVQGALSDPVLTVFRGGEPILTQNDWGDNPGAVTTAEVAVQVGAFALPEGGRDAAFVVTLDPGAYTVQVSGVEGLTGVALVEVYVVP